MLHEVAQQAKFGRPHRDDLAVPHHLVRNRIELDIGIAQHLAGERGAQAAQHRLDARDQFARAERLGDIIVGAGFQPANTILFLGSFFLLVGAPYAAARGISVEAVGAMILGIVGMNGVPEALVSGIIVVPIVMTLKKSGWKLK